MSPTWSFDCAGWEPINAWPDPPNVDAIMVAFKKEDP